MSSEKGDGWDVRFFFGLTVLGFKVFALELWAEHKEETVAEHAQRHRMFTGYLQSSDLERSAAGFDWSGRRH